MRTIVEHGFLRRHAKPAAGILVVAVATLLFFYRLGEKDLWERSEGRSAFFGRHMVESSEYLVPALNGRPFVDNRPPGYYWLVAGAYKVTGVRTEFVARVPAALAAVVCVVLVYWFGCQFSGWAGGLWSSVVLLGIVKFTWQARLAEQDILLTLWTALGYWAFWQWLKDRDAAGRRATGRYGWPTLLHVLVGLGAMTKGPAIVLTLVFPLCVYVLVSRRWREVDWWPLLITSPLSVVLSLWWFVYVWVALPAEQGQLIERFLDQGRLHVRHWYYYVVELPGLLGPATLLLPLLWWRWREAPAEERRGELGFLLTWFLGNLAIFSVFPSKQSHYLVPAFPGLALALGPILAHLDAKRFWLSGAFVVVIMAVLVVAPLGWVLFAPDGIATPHPILLGVFLSVCGLAAVLLGLSLRAGRVGFAFRAAWSFWLLGIAVVFGDLVPQFNHAQSARHFADKVDESLPVGARLGVLSNNPGILFYLDEPAVIFDDAFLARAFLEDSDLNYVVAESDVLNDEFKDFEQDGTEVVLEQGGFMKRGVSAFLLRDPD